MAPRKVSASGGVRSMAVLVLVATIHGDGLRLCLATAAAQEIAAPGGAGILLEAGAGPGSKTNNPAQQDRDLREEQLLVARQLYQEWPRSDAVFVMGMVCHQQGDIDGAIRYWEEETRLDPATVQLHDRAEAFSNLGDVLLEKGEYEKSAAMLHESLRLNPTHTETHYRLAHLFYVQGQLEDCLRELADGKVESAKGYGLRGQACQRLGNLEEARQNFETALRLNPKYAEACYGLAMVCARLGKPDEAEEYRRRFSTLQSQHQVMGRQIRADFNPLATTRRSLAETHTAAAWVYLNHGQPDLAEKLWLRAAAVDPANTACRFQLVMLYQKARRNQEALRLCQEMIRAEPANNSHYLGLGNLHARLKQYAEAEAAFRKATELAPARPEGFFALAQFYVQTKTNLTEAVRLSQQAVNLAPAAPHYYILSQACAGKGDLPAARAAIEKACELDPRTPQYQNWRAALQSGSFPK